MRPPEAAAPGVADSAPDTTAAYVGDVARDVALAEALDDALDAPEVGARVKSGLEATVVTDSATLPTQLPKTTEMTLKTLLPPARRNSET